ncbi:MAG: carboxypeptidase regulatory-like domain-containing protein [Deltaproteobacteria bacterium]|nr:carboxypeptidase regulatory-like domain-containing protein [Deltaproteobacteria bacterium]
MKLSRRLPVLFFISLGLILTLGYVSSTAEDTEIPIEGDPRSLAINPATDQAVTGSVKPNEISVVDLDTEQVISTIRIGKKPLGVAVDSTGNLALVAQKPSHTLSIVSLITHQPLVNISVGKSPASVAVYERASGPHLGLTANYKDNTVSVVDLNQFIVLQTIRVGRGPRDLAVDSDLGLALVVNEKDETISVIDLTSFQVTRIIPAGNAPRAISINSETHLAAIANTKGHSISIINLSDWQTQTIPVDKKPVDLAMNPLDNTVLVVCEKSQSLLRIDLNTNRTLQEYPLNKKTRGVAVNPFTNIVAVVDGQTDSLTLIQLPNPIPSIQSIAPLTIPRGNPETQLSIQGSGFLKTSTIFIQPSVLPLPVSFINNHHLTVRLPQEFLAQAGTWQVVVDNPAPEGGASPPAVLTVTNPVPAITAIDPASTQSGGPGLTVTLYGTGFFPETTVSVNGQNRSGSYINGNEIKINLLSNDLALGGTLSITASNPSPGGGTSNPMTFTILNPVPVLSSLNPNSIKAGSPDFPLNLTGNNFVTASSVRFNNLPVLATFVDSTHLLATIPATAIATKGTYPVVVSNPAPGGGFSGPLPFSVMPASNVNPLPAGAYGKQYEDFFPADATLPSYDPKRFSLITGLVNEASGSPLSEVTVGLHSHTEYGTAKTDPSGRFSIPLDGGGTITVTYQKAGYLPVHRQVRIGWNTIAKAETIVMIPEDTAATTLTFDGNPQTILSHRSTPTSDSSGTRSLTMVFTGDNRAWAKDAQGLEQPLTSITVRATEYPTAESMPARLPPTSAFTYCAELAVDGARSVRFEKPMVVYVDNFLGFNVGEIVPVGYYDRDRAVWVPQNNGQVVRLLDTDNDGIVDAYTNGRNQYPAPGLADPTLYPPDATFWRVEHSHFSPLDYNWSLGPEAGATPPPPFSPVIQEGDPCPITSINSYVENKNCIFHEDIPVPGTDLKLHYSTNRTVGYKSVVTVPVSGAGVPSILRYIVVKMEVAGRIFQSTVPALANKKVEFVWDGLDYLGRPVTGSTLATISVGYVYRGSYYSADNSGYPQAFAQTGITMTRIFAREEAILWRHSTIIIQRGIDTLAEGWTLSSHHFMSPADPSVLYKGDGSTVKNSTRIITTIAGNGQAGFSGDGGPAIQAKLTGPWNVTVGKTGTVYIVDTNNHRDRKVDRNGIITTLAGNNQWYFSGDGGPATQAGLGNPTAVAVDDAGNVYIAASYRIRKVNSGGIITTIAGNGQSGYNGDGIPATQASFSTPSGIFVDPAGNLYLADSSNNRIRKVDTNGIITTVAGNGQLGFSGDGGPAVQAKLWGPCSVALDDNGNIYISDAVNHRIRKVDTSGIITTVAGNGQQGFSGDGGPAIQAQFNNLRGISVDGVGNIFLSDRNNERIRKVNTSGIITTIAGSGIQGYGGDGGPAPQGALNYPEGVAIDSQGNIYIAEMFNNRIRKVSYPEAFRSVITAGDIAFSDEDGQGYIMSSTGLHQSTIDLETGKTLLAFSYNPENQLESISDRFGNRTYIQRDGGGKPLSLTSPDGIVTRLTVDGNNHLTAVTYPDHSAYSFIYTSEGLMTDKYDPRNNRFRHVFNPNGLITDVFDPEGGNWSFSRSVDNSGRATVTMRTGEGNVTTYLDRTDSTGAYTSITTSPFGLTSTFFRSSDGLTETEQPACGMSQTWKYDLDPAFQYKYLKEFTRRSPTGLTQYSTDSRMYQDTNADTIADRVTKILGFNGKNWTAVNNTLTGTLTGTSPLGRTLTRAYDPLNLLTRNMTVTGLLPVSYGYDTRGRLTTTSTGSRTSTITYDNSGNIGSLSTPDGKTFYYAYDLLGRLKTQTLPDTTLIGYAYDANGNMTVLTNPRTISYGFDYSGVNLRQTLTTPLSGSYQYTYDKERNLKSILFPSGREIGNTYANSLLTATTTPEGVTGYTYTCGTNLQEAIRGSERIAYTYDGSLLKTDTRTGLLNQSIGYGYNSDFRLTSLSYAGASQSLTYDNDGLLTGAGFITITRNAQNGLPVTVSDGTLINSRTFNGYGELDGSVYTVGGANKYSYSLTRDLAGRITQKLENVDGITDTYDYGYDSNGRLNEVRKNSVIVESYSYDPNGNRLTEINALRGLNRSYTVSDEDHVLIAGTETYRFDIDGFLTAKTAPTGTLTTTYSSRGELLSATLPSGSTITYDHDPMGRRIAKRMNGAITEKYLWKDTITLLAVYDASDNLLMRFNYADGRMPVSITHNGSTYYPVYDQVGSLKAVTDPTGNIVKKIDYDSFGSIISDTNPALRVPLGFAGGLHDRDTNFVRFGARDYDPSIGKWTAKDPIDFDGGDTNLYGYVLNDPVNWVDPVGLFCGSGITEYFVPDSWWGQYNFSNSCKKHDNCYSTCGKKKQECDKDFLRDMLQECSKLSGYWRQDCSATSNIYYHAVDIFGSPAYQSAQNK